MKGGDHEDDETSDVGSFDTYIRFVSVLSIRLCRGLQMG